MLQHFITLVEQGTRITQTFANGMYSYTDGVQLEPWHNGNYPVLVNMEQKNLPWPCTPMS